MGKVIIYTEIPKDKDENTLEVENIIKERKNKIYDYCKKENYDTNDFYIDIGYSGKNFKQLSRKELKNAINLLINNNQYDTLVLYSIIDISRHKHTLTDKIQYFFDKKIKVIDIKNEKVLDISNEEQLEKFKNYAISYLADELSKQQTAIQNDIYYGSRNLVDIYEIKSYSKKERDFIDTIQITNDNIKEIEGEIG